MTEQVNQTAEQNAVSSTSAAGSVSKDFVSREDMNALLDKVRKQEADKIRKDREEQERQNAELKAELELIKQNLARKVDLPKPEPPAEPTVKDLLAQIEELKATVTGVKPKEVDESALLQKATELARKEAEKLHFENMRASLLASSGLPDYMVPLVNGQSIEDVQKQIKTLKDIRDREEKAIRDTLSKQLESKIPKLISPNGAGVNVPAKQFSPGKHKTQADFEKWKEEALSAIRNK